MTATKKKRLKALGRLLCAGMALALLLTLPALAQGTSFSYTYDYWKSSVPVPTPYEAEKPLSGTVFGGKTLQNPTDLFVTADREVWVLDAGNNRLVVLDETLNFQCEITLTQNGEPVEFQDALGLFVNTDAKVVVDTAGIIYVISANTYSGALQYDEQYAFVGFYGSERVAVTPKLLMEMLWKRLLSEEQAAGMMRSVPTSFINFDIDAENFIYTIKGGTGEGTGQIRKLNPMGTNILFDDEGNTAAYGDLETYFDSQANLTISTTFYDIVVDDAGFITALDNTRNRLFQYDQNSNLLYAFGGTGTQRGTFKTPVAVEALGDSRLEPTDFGRNVRQAILLFNDGLYEQAMGHWQEILKRDSNYELANIGMGKIYEKTGDYAQAMEYYRRGNEKTGYSDAFAAQRDDLMRRWFAVILTVIVVLLLVMVVVVNYKERHRKNEYGLQVSKWRFPLRCIFHPFKAYYELKVEKKGSLLLANLILLAFFVTSILNAQLTGFHFNENRTDRFNVFITLGMTIGLFLIWVVCNWAISTLADGEGKFREIWIFTAYALLPYVISLAVLTILSNSLSLEESAFLTIAQTLAYVWTGINLLWPHGRYTSTPPAKQFWWRSVRSWGCIWCCCLSRSATVCLPSSSALSA